MNKIEKLQSLIKKAESFLNRDLTADNPEFQAWNSSLIRFSEKEYGKDSITTKNFKERSYSLHVWTDGTPESYWVEAFEDGVKYG